MVNVYYITVLKRGKAVAMHAVPGPFAISEYIRIMVLNGFGLDIEYK